MEKNRETTENPSARIKTRAQDFFQKHPHAPRIFNTVQSTPIVCARACGYCETCENDGNHFECWRKPMKREEAAT